ncbi:MAG: hypothetical protein AB7P67_05925 [Vicinamibacterales bacterium]
MWTSIVLVVVGLLFTASAFGVASRGSTTLLRIGATGFDLAGLGAIIS